MVTRLATCVVEHGSTYGFFGDCYPRSQDKNSQIHKFTHSQGVGVCYKRYKLVMSNIFFETKGTLRPGDQREDVIELCPRLRSVSEVSVVTEVSIFFLRP